MADSLYLSLWFADFEVDEMLPRVLSVLRAFPYSAQRPGVHYIAVHPVSWNEATVLEQRFSPGVPPEQAVLFAADLLHEDYVYTFEASWDLWIFDENQRSWQLKPSTVQILVHGDEFDEETYREDGNIQVDFGLDSPFLQESVELDSEAESKVRANVQKLVDFIAAAEKNSGPNSRLLWSESEENLAQKLISRLQKVN